MPRMIAQARHCHGTGVGARAVAGLWLVLGGLLTGCAGPPQAPVSREIVVSDAALLDATYATRFLLRIEEVRGDGTADASAACGVSVGPDLILTAAHCVPGELLAGVTQTSRMLIDDHVRVVRLVGAGYRPQRPEDADAGGEDADVDWALLRVEQAGGAGGGRGGGWASAPAWGEPAEGEAAYVVGFPLHYLPAGWKDGLKWADDLAGSWSPPAPVVIEGRVERVDDGWFRVRTRGALGERARGASGGGVFVWRGGGLVLVGVANKSRMRGSFFSAAVVPDAARGAMTHAAEPDGS